MLSRIIPLIFSLILTGCINVKDTNPTPTHNASNSLDWPGIYEGTLPCSDCEGVDTRLTLHSNYRFNLQERYRGKSEQWHIFEGSLVWNSLGNTVTLKGDNEIYGHYFVGENVLFLLNQQGEKNSPALRNHPHLHKLTPTQ